MANRPMSRCSISLIIREMQIKTKMRDHLIAVIMVIIKESTNNKCRRGYKEKRTLIHCWWGCKLGQTLYIYIVYTLQPLYILNTVQSFLRKRNIELPYDPEIPFLGIYSDKTTIRKDACTPMFVAALFTVAKTWKQSRCPSTDEQIKKLWYIYTMKYYSAIKKQI